ncbi:FAD-dependent oxidoreductase [Ponticoccus sp. SC2-23]|uniref:GcvT family protein n=1 Tax=Alexandriicola marinus TaxID=2081710 RepID=UPI000FDA9835|nr:FAD-dependent oxidoreductase [Alexandriicola marinus]MBM1218883.1 FAD-dependent oxidoreductase [Ponticoccus sp. SC6-9]MBM1224045.1 FAD-dependent oxidoreductase [Ponticoccus sp. SC6-15]MBM1230176.1 FAD-dependent oxidoreductase [Ponticoccus sp. SC6-38]MBM1233011.1 FAD-dependent oxidoreductase [Ponticoccus sp. SC6-45]MBM1237039.1 FAD-dependent oxidoreductase [Ponticoccus sp. SC6-49]MBM1242022.1 FAD-dependent oxidoreductase [Ponticoccus sp. SC2-64]MBM1246535.1 FAD-dependent oxidoreductase [Po
MQTTTRVAVIGGGVVGCSVLYHLTKLGWSDVMLIERSELTSGSTWHAAGGFHTLNGDTNMAALQGYTIKLYRELEEITGMSCGLHHVGGVTLAADKDRFDMLVAERAKHRYMGLETEIIGPDEIAKLAPITNLDGIIGGLYDPLDGHLDPSGTTHAYAKAARMGGATIETHCMVRETTQRPDGTWDVVTDKGTIHAEHVVNAGGLWAREVAAMAGIYLPLHPMEHQYLVTEEVPEIYERESEHPHVMDPAGESYLRQEGRGLCIGFYEQNCRPWAVDGTPWQFGHELLPDDFEKIEDSVAFAFRRFPVLERAGIKSVIHGPFTFAPDGNPLVGPIPGLRNYWSACGVMAGFSQGGGVGLMLAQWMVEGEPERDVMAMDVARFGRWITPGYTLSKVVENYQTRFSVVYPNEELPAARPLRTTPMYDTFDAMGAVWGQQYGLEVVNYFADPGEARYETPSFRRSNAWDATAREVAAVRGSVGINEVQNFGKYDVQGAGARAWLDRIMAGRIPGPGRLSLTPMLSEKGKIIGDFTVACLSETHFQLIGSYGAQAYHMRWFMAHEPEGEVTLDNVSDRRTGFQIAGPRAREVLQAVAREDVSDMRFMDVRQLTIGLSTAVVQRVSYTGDLGYEIYVDAMEQRPLWDTLWTAGQPFGMKPFGMRAMMSLRLDRFFGSWMREFSPDYTPAETGMDRFIRWDKAADFIGRAAAEAERITPPARTLLPFEVDATDADVTAYEPIFIDGEVRGFCTSGGYSHHTGKSIAFGLVPRDMAREGLEVEIEILGQRRPARHLSAPIFDPDRTRYA